MQHPARAGPRGIGKGEVAMRATACAKTVCDMSQTQMSPATETPKYPEKTIGPQPRCDYYRFASRLLSFRLAITIVSRRD